MVAVAQEPRPRPIYLDWIAAIVLVMAAFFTFITTNDVIATLSDYVKAQGVSATPIDLLRVVWDRVWILLVIGAVIVAVIATLRREPHVGELGGY
jgi:hypothetical protein